MDIHTKDDVYAYALSITSVLSSQSGAVLLLSGQTYHDSQTNGGRRRWLSQLNTLRGFVLIFGDTEDLKRLLDMTFGEWARFKMHCLSSQSHEQDNNRILGSSYSRLPTYPLHGHHQHPCNKGPQ